MMTVIERARTFLFVPASRPQRFAKALESGADCVILDLEDAVPPDQKAQARKTLHDWLEGFSHESLVRSLVRINAAGSVWHGDDMRLVAQWTAKGLAGAILAKAEMPAQLQATTQALGPSACVVPLVESLAGLDAVNLLARVPQVARLAFGHLDFQHDMGMRCSAEEAELAPVRFAVVAASHRAGLAAPVDGVTVDTKDAGRLRIDALRSKASGFGGKLCIHPSQLAVVSEVFSPSAAEIQWAERVVAEARTRNGEAFSLDGRMVDLPVVLLAQRTLQQAGTGPQVATTPH